MFYKKILKYNILIGIYILLVARLYYKLYVYFMCNGGGVSYIIRNTILPILCACNVYLQVLRYDIAAIGLCEF